MKHLARGVTMSLAVRQTQSIHWIFSRRQPWRRAGEAGFRMVTGDTCSSPYKDSARAICVRNPINKKPADFAGGLFPQVRLVDVSPCIRFRGAASSCGAHSGLLLRCGAPRRHDRNVSRFPRGVVIQL